MNVEVLGYREPGNKKQTIFYRTTPINLPFMFSDTENLAIKNKQYSIEQHLHCDKKHDYIE